MRNREMLGESEYVDLIMARSKEDYDSGDPKRMRRAKRERDAVRSMFPTLWAEAVAKSGEA